MKYIVFGAGVTGERALWMLGDRRVECFASNYPSNEIGGKEIISYPAMIEKAKAKNEYIIVVASEKYWQEMERQLCGDQIFNYFIYHEADAYRLPLLYPNFSIFRKEETLSYTRILALNHIDRYGRIAVYGTNQFLPYLISEVMFQAGMEHMTVIIDEPGKCRENTLGLPVRRYDDVKDQIDCLIINKKRESDPFVEILADYAHPYKCINIYDIDGLIPEYAYPQLIKYKNIHKGQRCFLIGNGPSLTIDDLNTLHEHQEVCFAFNRIFKVYNETAWRPDYFGISDGSVLPANIKEIEGMSGVAFVADEWHRWINVRLRNIEAFHWIVQYYEADRHPRFSDDITKGTYFGYSVVYDIGLQFAAYMGFKEIYLLGVDHSFTPSMTDENNHFIKDYFTAEEKEHYRKLMNGKEQTEKEKITRAYETAERYSREHGFRIYNATRGGELEVFERISFDSLFGGR